MDLSKLSTSLSEVVAQGVTYSSSEGWIWKPYREVHADVARASHRLRAWGVEPRMRIGLLSENSYDWIVHDLALLQLDCVSVCFSPEEFAHQTVDELAERYGLHLLLISQKVRQQRGSEREWLAPLAVGEGPTVRLRHPSPTAANAEVFALDDDICTLVFSSGTSGKLKCLLISKRGTEALIESFGRLFHLQLDDAILAFLPLSIFQQRWMVFTALHYGFSFQLVDPPRLLDAFAELKPTIFGAPPIFYETLEQRFMKLPSWQRELLAAASSLTDMLPSATLRRAIKRRIFAPIHRALGGRIRLMLTGAAPTRPATLKCFHVLGLPLLEGYGLTETGYVSLNVPGQNRRGSVGRPVREGSVSLAADGEVIVHCPLPLSRGYLFSDESEQQRTYLEENRIATGDIGKFDEDGYLYLLGRKKEIIVTQGGYKVHPETLEREIERAPEVSRAVVFGGGQLTQLAAVVSLCGNADQSGERHVEEAIAELNGRLPVPSRIGRVVTTRTPFTRENGLLNRNQKVDRRAVFSHFERQLLGQATPPAETIASPVAAVVERTASKELLIARVWREVLGVRDVGAHDNFFDAGGNSLMLIDVHRRLQQELSCNLPTSDLFRFPTIRRLAAHIDLLERQLPTHPTPSGSDPLPRAGGRQGIAIIGMAGRFPGAKNVEQFWRNLCDGIEAVGHFSEEELLAAGVDPSVLTNPHYVKGGGYLDGADLFDAGFFGYSPREAELIDPQQRLFLEIAWEALEVAGYDPQGCPEKTSVFAGVSHNNYLFELARDPRLIASRGPLPVLIGGDKDFLATRVAYKLNLRGPAMNVQTACSTTLVAVHTALQSLEAGDSDMALVGGASVLFPKKMGYLCEEGGSFAPDGCCRAFDMRAAGTVPGNGVGVVVLKRLNDALADGDTIYSVILGSAINNDGAMKVGYTAPSVEGQAAVIRSAQRHAGAAPETITYIEAHGTGTKLGDPIEIAALTLAFGTDAVKPASCAIGSVKTNIGHLDTAAGIASLIKTSLALKHHLLPPSLHFESPNPQIDFSRSPFFVNTRLAEWKSDGAPRRAGVSAFGIGGTNAHVILEEPPAAPKVEEPASWQLLPISAKTDSTLASAVGRLADHLQQHPEVNLADAAFTLQVGRTAFEQRAVLVCRDRSSAITALRSDVVSFGHAPSTPSIVFLFAGESSSSPRIGRDLYRKESAFRQHVDRCCELLQPHLGSEWRDRLFTDVGVTKSPAERPEIDDAALFVIQYALAQQWIAWGIRPQTMLGYGVGELVAACLADVFSLDDLVLLVMQHGKVLTQLDKGSARAISRHPDERRPSLVPALALSTGNHSGHEQTWEADDVEHRSGTTVSGWDGGFPGQPHGSPSGRTPAMDDPLAEAWTRIKLSPPTIPILSPVTGTRITDKQALDISYWAESVRDQGRLSDCFEHLIQDPASVLVEIGPGDSAALLATSHPARRSDLTVIRSLPGKSETSDESLFLLEQLGRLWLVGAEPDWPALHSGNRRQRIPLPTYPFERQRYWLEPPRLLPVPSEAVVQPGPALSKVQDPSRWLYTPTWNQSDKISSTPRPFPNRASWLLFIDDRGIAAQLAERLRQQNQDVVMVEPASAFSQSDGDTFTLNPQLSTDYDLLLEQLKKQQRMPGTVVHFWSAVRPVEELSTIDHVQRAQELGYHSLVRLAKAIATREPSHELQIIVVSEGLHEVSSRDILRPERVTVLGPVMVIPRELPNITCRNIDVAAPTIDARGTVNGIVDHLMAELSTDSPERTVAYREGNRYLPSLKSLTMPCSSAKKKLKRRGVYLISGGLGKVGMVLAEHLARTVSARLVLTRRSPFPRREEWNSWQHERASDPDAQAMIQNLKQLEELGAEVMTASVDAANLEDMKQLIDEAERRFGPLDGVIHTVGCTGSEAIETIRDSSDAVFQRHLAAKVYAPLVLAELVRDKPLDFCILFSSVASFIGGSVSYTAVNRFVDLFARQQARENHHAWLGYNSDTWRFSDLGDVRVQDQLERRGSMYFELSHTVQEGLQVFDHALTADSVSQIVISTGDLIARIALAETRNPNHHPLPVTASKSRPLYPRPQLANPYEAPQSAIERSVASIIQDVLGIAQVGRTDNFLDLGGDSLYALQLISRIRAIHKTEIPLKSVFTSPTAATIAQEIIRAQDGGTSTPTIIPAAKKIRRVRRDSDGGLRSISAVPPPSDAHRLESPTAPVRTSSVARKPMDFSLLYFSADESNAQGDKYRLFLESAKFADQHGFKALWTPERHFNAVGGLYPNPAVTCSALAMITERIQLRAGSVVLPLQSPIRVAEEWAAIDNLSHGRVEIAFSSGWHADDFALCPEAYGNSKRITYQGIETVRRLWRGEAVTLRNGVGKEIDVHIFPKPVQPELPIWLSGTSPQVFEKAGEIGAHVLSSFMDLPDLRERIQIYHRSLREHGRDPAEGKVAFMVFAYLDENADRARERARDDYVNYIRANVTLHKNHLLALGQDVGALNLTEEDFQNMAAKRFNDMCVDQGLIGSPSSCLDTVERLHAAGVTELACLIDFVGDNDAALRALKYLDNLREICTATKSC